MCVREILTLGAVCIDTALVVVYRSSQSGILFVPVEVYGSVELVFQLGNGLVNYCASELDPTYVHVHVWERLGVVHFVIPWPISCIVLRGIYGFLSSVYT